ncbi:MAG TPA: response regulator transcription factor [Bacteroidales bacterium]|nr:response regulator transcription factor [Bacteroidales bacterium]
MENKDYTILLVDDEDDILEFLGYNLKKEGYQVLKAKSGRKAIELAMEYRPHLIVLDVMMPGMDGMETCAELKKIPTLSSTIIAFLTARGEDYSQIAGLDAGADDYIAKPIRPKVFLSRVQALLRRSKSIAPLPLVMELAEFTIDRGRYVVITPEGEEISLPRKEFELLSLLASAPNRVFSRDEIFRTVWGEEVIVGERTIDVHIRRIRERLGTENIKTLKGVGYKYETK